MFTIELSHVEPPTSDAQPDKLSRQKNSPGSTEGNIMPKFMFLCLGGEAPAEGQGDALMHDWMTYMSGIAATGKLRDGAPLGPGAKLLTAADAAEPYDLSAPDAVNGYWIMEVADMDEAVASTAGCPHYACKGKVAVLEITQMPMPQ